MTQITVSLPEGLYRQMERFVSDGWFRDDTELVSEAVRRYIESHSSEMAEQFVRDDIEWGLRGRE